MRDMDLWRYTFEELTGGIESQGESVALPVSFEFGDVTPFTFDPKYGTARVSIGIWPQDQALVRQNASGEWESIGCYIGDTLMVWEDGRRGLGTKLFLRCIKHRNQVPITKKMTGLGARLIKSAHKEEIKKAVVRGEQVRKEVREEYGL